MLRTRYQKPKEELSDFAADVQRLTTLAFHDCSAAARDRICMRQFVDGIANKDLQDMVRLSRPTCFDDAIWTSMEFEACKAATRGVYPIRHLDVQIDQVTPRNEDSLREMSTQTFVPTWNGGFKKPQYRQGQSRSFFPSQQSTQQSIQQPNQQSIQSQQSTPQQSTINIPVRCIETQFLNSENVSQSPRWS